MIIEKFKTQHTAFELFHAFKDDPYCFLLDSSMQNDRLGRFTFMGSCPFLIFKSKNENITITEGEHSKELKGNPFELLRALMHQYKTEDRHPIPFLGGAVGFLSYDLCHSIEKLPRTAIDENNIPDCCFGFYDRIVAVDHKDNDVYMIAHGLKEKPEAEIDMLKKKLSRIPVYTNIKEGIACGEIQSNFTKDNYMKAVQRIKDYIRSGDIYQANMTQRFKCHTEEDSFSLYSRLRQFNPAPFACYMDFDEGQILSSSPERFLKIEEKIIETRPIKGTRPRGKTHGEDEANKEELLSSEKDKSELLMIVDLERNDLGKVSKTGTIKVPELFYLEEYATVHHLVSTVTGEMRDDIKAIDVIQSAFPGGSITGAPKIRAMEVIDELEPTQRNIYTGSIGYLDFNGNMDLNIAIRTIVMKDHTAFFQAGGGIVWDSDPELEYEETLHKAKALFRTLRNEK
ncbi:MAG: aminodeoxychorismate synthase, subunit [Clostridia bacterium]|jgi:para-aminobenzoate synthetase component 1|nr:aminodeoxychorismate synthase, subunit [Clostridia bacterium]